METTTVNRALVTALCGAALGWAPALGAQETSSPEPTLEIGCFAGHPLPRCRSFWIVEVQGAVPMAQSVRHVDWVGGRSYPQESFGGELAWNLGHMVNVSPRWAVGGVFTLGTGNDDPLTGLRLRTRRWLLDEVSLELEGGLLRSNAKGYRYPGTTGITADLRLNIRDQGSLFIRWDGLDLPSEASPGDWGHNDPGGWQHGLYLGASLGSKPAVFTTGALAAGYVILLALLINTLDT